VMYKLKTKDRKQSNRRTSSLTTINSKSQQKVIKTVKMAKFKYLLINEKNWQRLLWEKVVKLL
jgi:nucleoside-triphosphatase THEP1